MISNAQAFRQYLKRRQDTIDNCGETRTGKSLYNEKTFYQALIRDMLEAKQEVIIYSPFVSKFRTDCLKSTIAKLKYRNIDVFIFTRPVEEYENIIRPQIEVALKRFEEMGVCVFYPGRYIHEKVAIIDREILWEGSLNILSHRASNEMMRRTESKELSLEVINHISIKGHLIHAYQTKYERLCEGMIKEKQLQRRANWRYFLLGISVAVWLIIIIIVAATMLGHN